MKPPKIMDKNKLQEAILKAVRGAEIGVKNLNLPIFEKETSEKIK